MTKPLSLKRETFCQAYVANGGNAGDAARAAGYAQAHMQGPRLMKIDEVASRVREIAAPKMRKFELTAERIFEETAKLAYFNLGDALHVTKDGDPYIDLSALEPDQMAALAEATIDDFVDRRETDAEGKVVARDVKRVKIKAHDKVAALTLGARLLKLLTDKVELTLTDDIAAQLDASRERALASQRERITPNEDAA